MWLWSHIVMLPSQSPDSMWRWHQCCPSPVMESERTKKDGKQPGLQCHTQSSDCKCCQRCSKANTVTIHVHDVFLFVIHFLCYYGMCCVQNIKEKNKVSFPRTNMEKQKSQVFVSITFFILTILASLWITVVCLVTMLMISHCDCEYFHCSRGLVDLKQNNNIYLVYSS